jgi:hypothetical protein
VCVGDWQGITFVLAPFFAPYRFPLDVVAQLPSLLPQRRLRELASRSIVPSGEVNGALTPL